MARFLTLCVLAAGCAQESRTPPPTDVAASLDDEVATVVHVRWTTERASKGYVQYGPTKEMALTSPMEAELGTQHSATLLELTADTPYYYRVVAWDGNEGSASEVLTFDTGSLPNAVPTFTRDGEGQEELLVIPVRGPTAVAVSVVDPSGDVVWYHVEDRDVEVTRALVTRDRRSIVYNAIDGSDDASSELVRIDLDDGSSTSVTIPGLAGDFVELRDGTLAAITSDTRDIDGTTVVGHQIVELDESGDPVPVWSAWDCFDPASVPPEVPEDGWTGANALAYDVGQDAYYIGLSGLSSIVKVPRQEGGCEWVLGGSAATFAFADGATPFARQSHFDIRGDRLLVVDGDESGDGLRLLEYQIEFEAELLTELSISSADVTVTDLPRGSVEQLDSAGTKLVNWAAAGRVELLDADGATEWSVEAEAGSSFGYHSLVKTLYPETL